MPVTLDDFMKGESIIVVDIETTGFSHQNDCIVEIGICELDLNSGEYHELFNKLVRETHFSSQHRNAWIFKNTNLRYEDIKDISRLREYIKAVTPLSLNSSSVTYKDSSQKTSVSGVGSDY